MIQYFLVGHTQFGNSASRAAGSYRHRQPYTPTHQRLTSLNRIPPTAKMAITSFTAPARTETDTIIARLVSDGNLVGVGSSDFSLHRADNNAEIGADISVARQGDFFWDITVQQTADFLGTAYIQIAQNAFRDLQSLARLPANPLNSNQFRFSAPAPTGLTASDGVYTCILRWTALTGVTYEIRVVDFSDWTEAETPHKVTGLSPDTEYEYELRQRDNDSVATIRKRTLAFPISSIDEQFIPVGAENYSLEIGITGQHAKTDVDGLQESFYQDFENLNDGNSRLFVKSELVTRLIEKAVWTINVSDTDWEVEQPITYNVVPVSPILIPPKRQTIWKGVPFKLLVEVLHKPTILRAESKLVGLKSETITINEKDYIQSAGKLPTDARLNFSTFNIDLYVENTGGNDTLQVPVDIRDDPVAPVINAIADISKDDGYASFTIDASLSAGTQIVTWSIDGIPGAIIQPTTGDMVTITIPSKLKGTHNATLTASNDRFRDTERFRLVVNAPMQRPSIGNIASTIFTSGRERKVGIYFTTPIDDGGTGQLTSLEFSVDGGRPQTYQGSISTQSTIYLTGDFYWFLVFTSGTPDFVYEQMVSAGRHTVRVRISNSLGTSPWSNTLSFVVP